MGSKLYGSIQGVDGASLSGIQVELIGSRDTIGAMERATTALPAQVAWQERDLEGFSGSRWNCWQRFLMKHITGITWPEFKDEVVERNPVLREDGFAFKAGKRYLLPTNPNSGQLAWTRRIGGFQGNRWDCWEQFLQGRINGLDWESFKDQVIAHNPDLTQSGYVFVASMSYILPELIVSAPQITWTRRISGFQGNRWDCWRRHVDGHVTGITWAQFKDDVVRHNPSLPQDGYVFQADTAYLLPENGPYPRYYVAAVSDEFGHYALEDLPNGNYQLVVAEDGYHPYASHVTLTADTEHLIALLPIHAPMISDWVGYANAPAPVRQLVDQALSMLGDDHVVYDALPPDLRQLAWGRYYAQDPNHFHYKDIVCSDLVTICLAAAGVDYEWEVDDPTGIGYTTTHAANYYRPRDDHPQLVEVAEGEPWQPGDILIYGMGELDADRVHHVDIYVGPFHGVDLSGNIYAPDDGHDVVNASIDYMSHGVEIGTAIKPFALQDCLDRKFGFRWCRRVRVVAL